MNRKALNAVVWALDAVLTGKVCDRKLLIVLTFIGMAVFETWGVGRGVLGYENVSKSDGEEEREVKGFGDWFNFCRAGQGMSSILLKIMKKK